MSRWRGIAIAIDRSPFWVLTGHFVKRIFASEEEQGENTVGFGVGAILAILALPGAFASIFLLDKYGTLFQWMRGHRIDAIRTSPADEYFFIVLSMTITGLVMVARWNRLFPDARDFSNLAVLPLPIRNIFLANFIALFGLALLFALDVNFASAFLFPLLVTLGVDTATMGTLFHLGISHCVTVLCSSMFSFFAVFALVGLQLLLVPRRLFRPVSLATRVFLVVALLTEFFSNLFLQLFAGHLPGKASLYAKWLPSYWFLGIYEKILGIAAPNMAKLGTQAALILGGTIVIAITSYTLCYRRYFLRLAESLDNVGTGRRGWLSRLPDVLLSRVLKSPFELASDSFVGKVLLRSEPHLMFFGAYLGIGVVMVAQTALDNPQLGASSAVPTSEFLAIPFLIAFFLVSGLRFVFDMPAALPANWIFQLSVDSPDPSPYQVARRLMLAVTIPWQVLLVMPVMVLQFGWRVATIHASMLVISTVLFIELMLKGFRKIPFTCSTQLEVRKLMIRFLGPAVAVLTIVPALSNLERWSLGRPSRFLSLGAVLLISWYVLHRRQRESLKDRKVVFEERPDAPFELLKLT